MTTSPTIPLKEGRAIFVVFQMPFHCGAIAFPRFQTDWRMILNFPYHALFKDIRETEIVDAVSNLENVKCAACESQRQGHFRRIWFLF